MPLNPTSLHLLRRYLPVSRKTLMSENPLSRIFPFKLKYQSLGSSYSTRDHAEPRTAPKSLIEDEEELSNWITGLRTNSFRAGLLTDEEEDADRGLRHKRGRVRGNVDDDGDNGGGSGRFNKRGRGGEFDDYDGDMRIGGRSSRDDGESGLRGRGGFERRGGDRGGRRGGGRGRGRGGFMSDGDDDDDDFGSRRGRGGRGNSFDDGLSVRERSGGRGGRRSGFDSRGGGRDGFESRGGGRGGFESRGGGRGGFESRGGGRGGFESRGGGRGGFESRGGGRGRGFGDGNGRGRGGFERRGGGRRGFMTGGNVDDVEEEVGRFDELRKGEGSSVLSRVGGGIDRRGDLWSKERLVMESETEDDDDEIEMRKEKREKSVKGFLELVEDDDSSDENRSESEEEIEVKSTSSLVENSVGKSSSEGNDDSYLSETRFDQCAVSHLTLKAIKDVGYERMTMVQEATLPVILKGKDVMAKARTGTGKTVAFLLPAIEVVVKTRPADRDNNRPPITVVIICPTRELASQAAAEAKTLLKYHPTLGVQVVIGGTKLGVEQKRMHAHPCQILVATPGRFKDHLENTAGFMARLKGVKVLVLDEADHLLDMGFRKDIETIVASVPKQRQTLLFSATIADEVRQICHIALRRDYEYINTVQEGSDETHSQVRQTHLVAPLADQFALVYAILKDHISDDVSYKVLVFCTTAMVTRLVADLLGELNLNVREIHSRKPQSYRTKVSDEFRKSKGLILVTSDVSARGVDYPDVTLVVQVGLPSDREQYIHRLGRTGRKGKEGLGILILAPWEESFLNSIKDLPISKATPPLVDPTLRKKVERALSNVEMNNKEAAYQAWLGYYNSTKLVGRDKNRLVELAREFSHSMGLDKPPAISKVVIGKMGLKNVIGLRSK